MEAIFEKTGVRQIDHALWLSSPIFSRQKNKDRIYDAAIKLGEDIARKTPINMESLKASMYLYGIEHIVTFSSENIQSQQDRAYYLPETKMIQYNQNLVEKIGHYCELEKLHIKKQDLLNMILLHEFFHHLEEWFYETVDVSIGKKFGYTVNPIYRELAAFAFVNIYIHPIKCQSIDLVWLKYSKPEVFERLKNSIL